MSLDGIQSVTRLYEAIQRHILTAKPVRSFSGIAFTVEDSDAVLAYFAFLGWHVVFLKLNHDSTVHLGVKLEQM